ncbi:MAG: hypothetical protein KC517_10015 [Bacteroidetes bacterium]|jgi:hypothetical protein|nr:hypothetical protein [Bacteroidota bacterium]
MKSIKLLLIVFLVYGKSIVSVQASNQCITSDKYWSDISTQLSNLSNGDTLFIEKELKLRKGSWTDLSTKAVTIVVKNGGELKFKEKGDKWVELKLGQNSKVVILNGGKIKADKCSGRKCLFIDNTVVATGSGDANGDKTYFGSNDNYTDPNGTLPSFVAVTDSGGADVNGALPVSWGPLSVTEFNQSTINLEWSTLTEINNSHFEVQLSRDGVNWDVSQTVESEAAGGNSVVRLDYLSLIPLPEHFSVFYLRLKQFDFDGTADFSRIVVFKRSNLNFQDPIVATVGQRTMEITGYDYSHLTVYASNGQLVWDLNLDGTVKLEFQNTGAHWFLFRTKSNQILQFKQMVSY